MASDCQSEFQLQFVDVSWLPRMHCVSSDCQVISVNYLFSELISENILSETSWRSEICFLLKSVH